jgi:anthranilate phosphoribosyltransferase
MLIKEFLEKVINKEISLDEQEAYLLAKNEYTAEELADAVTYLHSNISKNPIIGPDFLDVCGTGGSGLPRINTSTLSAYMLSKKGIKVAKHGNKAASGRCGSFDLLERIINEYKPGKNLHFLYAREYYPIMANFAEVRKKIGKPTFFNLLGPMLSPNQARKQIIGTAFKDKMLLMAQTCKLLGRQRVMVVRGQDGLDEVTLTGPTDVVELNDGNIESYQIDPSDFGLQSCKFEEIAGGDLETNYNIAKSILDNKCSTRHTDLVHVNVALAFKLLGICEDLESAYKLACEGNILDVIVASDKRDFSCDQPVPSQKDFEKAMSKDGKSLILEIKNASPTEGRIVNEDRDIEIIVKMYEEGGASAISVVTEPNYFSGSFELLTQVSSATSLPILCKDFITQKQHVVRARNAGADAILLIAKLLSASQIQELSQVAKDYGMDVLCEVHDEEELNTAIEAGAKIIGVNNRDLNTFIVDLNTTNKLAAQIPEDCLLISESGIRSAKDVRSMPENVDGLLIGTQMLKSNFLDLKIKELMNEPLVKICGVRSFDEALHCEQTGVDMIGLNFVESSHRCISKSEAEKISDLKVYKVGVFQDQELDFVNRIAESMSLDMIQLSGNEDQAYIDVCIRPVIKTVFEGNSDYSCEYLILDGSNPGSGSEVESTVVAPNKDFLIAGGLTPENVASKVTCFNSIGADCASGVETDSQLDLRKVDLFFKNTKNAYSNGK